MAGNILRSVSTRLTFVRAPEPQLRSAVVYKLYRVRKKE